MRFVSNIFRQDGLNMFQEGENKAFLQLVLYTILMFLYLGILVAYTVVKTVIFKPLILGVKYIFGNKTPREC